MWCRDPAKLSPTLLASLDSNHLCAALGNLNQLAVTSELREEIAMELHASRVLRPRVPSVVRGRIRNRTVTA